jgi:hypothetical protein
MWTSEGISNGRIGKNDMLETFTILTVCPLQFSNYIQRYKM